MDVFKLIGGFMCLNKSYQWLVSLFFFLLFYVCSLDAQAQDRWFLISETELQSIEQYKITSEQEKQNWLLQVQGLRRESESLNDQLGAARHNQMRLSELFNKYERESLTQIYLKNGEIANLKQELSGEKKVSTRRLFFILALAGIIVVYVGFKIYRFIKGKR